MPIEQLMWVEKYRPWSLDELVDQKEIKQRLKLLVEKKGELPHLLFAGPPGSGKTTTALIIARQLLGEDWRDYTLSLNASDERGIDIVRERVKTFARFSDRREGIPFRLVILDECDEMCLDPDTRILVGNLNDLKEASLRELYASQGTEPFSLPSFGDRGMRLEDDEGRIVPSGTAELFRITFEDGRSITASADHPFFQVHGRKIRTLKTRDLVQGTELAEFSDRILRCYNCSKPFHRPNQWTGYVRHFCSTHCRNAFFGALSTSRTTDEKRRIRLSAERAIREKDTFKKEAYRLKRAEVAKRLIETGKIPDPRTWPKFAKGEGIWTGKDLSEAHRRAISLGDRRFFETHPEVKTGISRKVRASLLDPHGPYQRLVRSGFFREASMKAGEASLVSWKAKGFRSEIELKMAELLKKWGIRYSRERIILSSPGGHKYPLAVDFVVGKIAIFVNGCWWHVCPNCGTVPRYEKQRKNMEKDHRQFDELERLGYKVVVIWEHELTDENLIRDKVLPRIFESIGISGGHPSRVTHARVKSIESAGTSEVLNVSVSRNKNFLLANGVLTHNTNDAQTALRRIMEETSAYTRFILVCNYSSGIIEPLQSRCAIFRFKRLEEAALISAVKEIASKEKVKVVGANTLPAVFEATQGDLRQAINLLQAASVSGELTQESVASVTGTTVKARVADIIKKALDGDFNGARTKMVELTRVYGVPERDFLRFANESVSSSESELAARAISILAEYDFRLVQGAQPELQLTAMLAELAALKGKGE